MKILAVDDERSALDQLVACLRETRPTAAISAFGIPGDALRSASDTSYDVAFLDIEMPQMNGLALARSLQEILPDINIIFVSAHREYAYEAFALHASGFICKCVTASAIGEELAHLRNRVAPEAEKRIVLHTFGNFEVYCDGVPVEFRYTKTKEMLAWLTDRRGALCSNNELMAVLWEDDIKESYFRNIRADLLNTLPEEIFVRQRGKVALRTDLVSCDYYDWIRGIPEAINAYNGEYMAQYSWGEWSMDSRRLTEEETSV